MNTHLSDVANSPPRIMSTALPMDDYDLADFLPIVASFGQERFGYVVTPNVDHLIRYFDDAQFRDHYARADFVLLDSRFMARLLSFFKGVLPRVCPGSDLTAAVFRRCVRADDPLVLVGATPLQAAALRERFDLRALHHIDPPMGFIRDARAVEACLQEIEAHSPFRYCFIAVGSPQQEVLASQLKARGVARGLALCIGASINFLTGAERRAPSWMQALSLEWLYRLLQDPRRLARRYLVRGPRIFLLFPRLELRLRRARA